ncbi:hypothetical protein OC835_005070 [Tilletia horrida]|uniref:Velvet domain-containing protein n=1 Tax=Tilletia horrida TaxID=155126 RepID=A0AAN6G934_9BASI|nr:hypothetical protein OC842_005480 [Tilletia horrida]KAK0527121.1 hypothetical protein OC835_005070 [Tilletia horrida]
MVRAATASSSSQGAPSLRHDYLTVAEPSPRSTQSHEWQQRANLCPSEPGLSSSDKPYRSSSSPPAVDVDERPGQLLDDPQVSATGLVKTLPTGLSFEEAEEAPPPSLSSLMLDPEKEPRRYVLDVVEQPAHGRLCGFTTRDRRMLDPTPILSLQIFDKDGHLDVG